MSTSQILLTIACYVLVISGGVYGQECKKRDPCSCVFPDNKVIDLSSLGFQNGTARFEDVWDEYYYSRYSYNPCYNFTEGNCTGVAACQYQRSDFYFPLGTQESTDFLTDTTTGQVTVQYNSTDAKGFTRITKVALKCAHKDPPVLAAIGETGIGEYSLTLTSESVCPK